MHNHEYYVFETLAQANLCLNAVNSAPYYPVTGKINGQIAPEDKQKTVKWANEAMEMTTGEWAVPRVKQALLDYVGVPASERSAFLANYGADIRTLNNTDFVQPPSDEDGPVTPN